MSEPDNPDSQASHCERCGTFLPANTPPGFCPTCLVSDLAGDEADTLFSLPGDAVSLDAAGFVIMEVIGRGGMGVVYRARQITPERPVAVKMLMPHLASSPESRRRFLIETEAMANLDHPCILPLFAAGESGGQPWLAMKLVEGGSLAEHRSRYAGQWRRIATLMADLSDAIQHAHSRGVIHRDLKPGNVLFDDQENPCLADFGLAKLRDSALRDGSRVFTLSHAVMGTLAYLSPEVAIKGGVAATTASDIYGLGAILYELLTGRLPFSGDGQVEILRRITEDNPALPQQLNPAIPADLQIICLKAMAHRPENRYASAAALAADFRAWLKGDPISARPVTITARFIRLARRHPLVAFLITALVLTLTFGSFFLWRQNVSLDKSLTRARVARNDAEDNVTYMTRELPALLKPIGRLELLDSVFNKIDDYYKNAAAAETGGDKAADTWTRRGEFLTQWSSTLEARGLLDEAVAKLESAAAAAGKATSLPGAGASAWATLAGAHRRRAEILLKTGRYDEAAQALDAASAAVDAGLTRFPGDPLLLIEQAEILTDRGNLKLTVGTGHDALPPLEEARVRWEKLAASLLPSLPPLSVRRTKERARDAHYHLARVAEKTGDYAALLSHDEAHLAACEALAKTNSDDAPWLCGVASACNRLALSLEKPENPQPDPARVAFLLDREESILRQVTARDPSNLEWKSEFAIQIFGRARRAYKKDDYSAAQTLTKEALDTLPSERGLLPATGSCRCEAWLQMAFASKSFRGLWRMPSPLTKTPSTLPSPGSFWKWPVPPLTSSSS